MGVRQKVEDHLLEPARVALGRQGIGEVDLQFLPLLPDQDMHGRHRAQGDGAQVDRLQIEAQRVGLELVIGQQVVDEQAEPFDIESGVLQELALVQR